MEAWAGRHNQLKELVLGLDKRIEVMGVKLGMIVAIVGFVASGLAVFVTNLILRGMPMQ
jgi:hypothetical protein